MAEQSKMNLVKPLDTVEEYEFEPIKGYPMLNWKGKRPFRSTQYYPAQLKENHGDPVDGWMNEIYWGDNLQVMSHLLKKYRGKIQLIYIDPPFDSKADYKIKIERKRIQIFGDYHSFEEKQYSDIWTNDEYLQFMFERIILLKELLSESGNIFLHCDWHKSYYLRCILDEIFGQDLFNNEIIWYYYNKMQGNINRFASNHDCILWYSKTSKYIFNKIQELRDKPIRQIKRIWDKKSQKLINAKDAEGNILYIESTKKTIDDVWRISMLQPADQTENLKYPTQKPEKLLERIILASSNPGDIVFDCFMGSGTTQAVAMKLGRRFIGADINLGAIQITTKRLIQVARELEEKQKQEEEQIEMALPLAADVSESYGKAKSEDEPGKYYTGFSVYNVNHYDIFRNPVQAKELLIQALEIQPLPGNTLYDGEKDGRMVKIMPINRIATKMDLNELITNFDYRAFEKRFGENPNQPVESLLLVCMGHEPDLAAALQKAVKYRLDIEVVDILRDKANLEFKRDAEARVARENGEVVIQQFFPMNLLQKLSLATEEVEDWRELVESVMVDFYYDGSVFEPNVVDVPDKNELVAGRYRVPDDAGTIRVKITDLLSESLEVDVD